MVETSEQSPVGEIVLAMQKNGAMMPKILGETADCYFKPLKSAENPIRQTRQHVLPNIHRTNVVQRAGILGSTGIMDGWGAPAVIASAIRSACVPPASNNATNKFADRMTNGRDGHAPIVSPSGVSRSVSNARNARAALTVSG